MPPVPAKLFHLTTLAALRKIMRTNRLHTGAFRAVSFTEDPKLFGQDFQHGNDFGSLTVRIVVDGDKLSGDYPVEPHVDGSGMRFLREKEWRVPGEPVENLRDYVKCVEVLSRRPHDATDDYWKNYGFKWNPKKSPDLRKKVLDDIIALGEETGFVVRVKDDPTDNVCESLVRGLIREMCKKPEYWGRGGAGIMFTCSEDDTVLLLLRAPWVAQGGTWGIPGGGVEEGWFETPIEDPITDPSIFRDAAFREAVEECGSMPPGFSSGQIIGKTVYEDCGFQYVTLIADITLEQKEGWDLVSNDGETDDFLWVQRSSLGAGSSVEGHRLHFGVEYTLSRM